MRNDQGDFSEALHDNDQLAWVLQKVACLPQGGPHIVLEHPILLVTTEGREALQIQRAKHLWPK